MTDKAPLSAFLAQNPFANGLTDGLFYREKMRAIHRIAPETIRSSERPPRILDIGGGRSAKVGPQYLVLHLERIGQLFIVAIGRQPAVVP